MSKLVTPNPFSYDYGAGGFNAFNSDVDTLIELDLEAGAIAGVDYRLFGESTELDCEGGATTGFAILLAKVTNLEIEQGGTVGVEFTFERGEVGRSLTTLTNLIGIT